MYHRYETKHKFFAKYIDLRDTFLILNVKQNYKSYRKILYIVLYIV